MDYDCQKVEGHKVAATESPIIRSKRAEDSRFYNPNMTVATENLGCCRLGLGSLSLRTREGHNGIGSFVFLSKASSPPRGQRVWTP